MATRERGIKKLLVPVVNAGEAAVVAEVMVFGANSLAEAVGIVWRQVEAEPVTVRLEEVAAKLNTYEIDFSDVRGQEFAKRVLVIAASEGIMYNDIDKKSPLPRKGKRLSQPLDEEKQTSTYSIGERCRRD